MAETMASDYRKPATPEEVWAIMRENAEQLQELKRLFREIAEENREKHRETDERMRENAERMRETDERMKKNAEEQRKTDEQMRKTDEQMKKTDRQMKKTFKQMGFLTNRFGELAEHLVVPRIHTRFNELGYSFSEVAPGGVKIIEDDKTKTEIDILLQNDETVMAIEIKVKPAIKDVEHHIKRLEILRDHRRKKNDHRKIQGAIAGAIFGSVEKEAVIEAGLYVIEQSGDTMKIDIPDGFVPREW